jgi:thiol reductant ABC exporter CydD subunit
VTVTERRAPGSSDGATKPAATPPRRSGPVDPRLLRYTRGTRRYLLLTVVLGGVTAALVLAQAWLIANTISDVVVHHQKMTYVRSLVVLLAIVILGRSMIAWLGERAAQRASTSAKSDLRTALVEKTAQLGPAGIDRERSGSLVVLATSGIDALDSYFARYLPQLFLAVIVPVTVVIVMLGADWISAVIIAVTVPLIPLFMALVGAATKVRMRRQARLLQRLAGHFLDVVAGLPTLKVFGRAKAQVEAVRDITNRYRTATMATLKVAFLSSLVLELLATFSVALVAVAIGLRLLGGHVSFATALFVLILAPEAYLPLRLLGMNYHASAEGMKAAEDVFDVLERPVPRRGSRRDVPDPSTSALQIDRLEVCYPGRSLPALRDTSLSVRPGEVLAIAGPSGCGKSTVLAVLLGLVPASSGSVTVDRVDLTDLDLDVWRTQIAWVPQRPHLFARSVADNVRLGRPDATDREVRSAIIDAGLDDVVAALPEGVATMLGTDGAGLSAGERQRVALARAFLRDAPLLLLDEPTANLDGRTEEGVLSAVRRLMVGRTVVMAAHRSSLLAMSDRVVRLSRPVPAAVVS